MMNVQHNHLQPGAEIEALAPGEPPRLERIEAAVLLLQRWGVLIAALLTLLVYGAPVSAQSIVGSNNDARTGAVMNVPINKSQTLRVERAIGKAVVGNDEVADVLPVSLSSVYVLGKAIGSTNLSLFDKKGALIAVVDIVVVPDAQGLKRKLAEMLPTEAIGVSVSNDSIILDGQVSSPAAAERVAAIAETYSPKKVLNMMSVATATQIMLEVRFAEMTRATVKQLGINNVSFGNGLTNTTGLIAAPSVRVGQLFRAALPFHCSNLSFRIDALEQQGAGAHTGPAEPDRAVW